MASTPRVKVAILCGGLGTRLGDLARDKPKSMVDVAGRPFLEYVVRSFAERGLNAFVMLTGHYGEQIEDHFGNGEEFGVRIEYSREREPVGTGGAVRQARSLLDQRFVLTYGDVYRRFDYDRFVAQHRGPCLAVYSGSFGNTEIAGGKVIRFDKKAKLPYVDAGFCVMPSSVIDLLGERGSFEETVFPALAGQRRLECETVDHAFLEIGTPEALANARRALA